MLAAIVLVAGFANLSGEFGRPISPGEAEPEQQQSEDASYHWLGDSWAQWMMAGFALVATGVSWRGLYLLRRTFEETKRTATAAIGANDIARDSAERQLRAYLSVDAEDTPVKAHAGDYLIGTFEMKNVGQTPATNVCVKSGCFVLNKQIEVDWALASYASGDVTSISLMPGATTKVRITSEQKGGWKLNKQSMAGVEAGTHRVVFFGQVEYVDAIALKPRYTRFQFEIDDQVIRDKTALKYSAKGNSYT